VRRGWLSVFSTLAIGFVCLAAPLRAQFVYVANESSNNVSAYSIGANGALTPVPGSPFAAGTQPQSVAVDPTAKFAYVANLGVPPDFIGNNISAYSIGANGALTPVPGSPFAAGSRPALVAVDPTGRFAYVANAGIFPINGSVSAYSIGANGALTQVPGSPFAAGNSPNSVAVDPTAKFAYVANFNGNNVSAFSIGANGALTPVPGSPFAAGNSPFSVTVDPTGKFAYVANASSNNVSAFSIGANGALTPVPGSPFAAGTQPFWTASGAIRRAPSA
jgi:6-phosphogluconolactonase